jgi:hypothetical protein
MCQSARCNQLRTKRFGLERRRGETADRHQNHIAATDEQAIWEYSVVVAATMF